MIRGIAAGRALQDRLVTQSPEAAFDGGIADRTLETGLVLDDRLAQTVERGSRRHPQTAADERPLGRKLEVEARPASDRLPADVVRAVPMKEPARRVRLVRRLVRRESNVAVDAKG